MLGIDTLNINQPFPIYVFTRQADREPSLNSLDILVVYKYLCQDIDNVKGLLFAPHGQTCSEHSACICK